jgi:hypothetical protein
MLLEFIMFSFFHRSSVVNVDCFTSNNYAYKFAPIVKASVAKPEWYNEVQGVQPSNTQWPQYHVNESGSIDFDWKLSIRTLKSCPGFHELYSRGFILENWCDFVVNVTKDTLSYHYSNGKDPILHNNNQVEPGFMDQYIIKLNSPWIIQTKENLPFVLVPAQWSLEKYNFHILPGMVNFYQQTGSNVFITIKKGVEDQFLIPMGQPLAQFIPLTDKKIKIHNHIVSEQELTAKTYNVTGTSMGWRRTKALAKRNEERQKKCPFGFGDK